MDLTKLTKTPSYNDAYGEYTQYLGSTKAPIDHYNEAVNSLGIPDARARVAADRKAISDTQSLVDAVDPSVTGRTQGSLVTEAQRQGLVTKEKSPLLESLGKLSGIYGTSSGNLADLMGQAQNTANMAFQGDQANVTALYNRMSAAQAAEEMKRQAAAQAQQNAWIQALQEQFANMGNQLRGQLNTIDTNQANRAEWQAMANRAITGNNYNPQQAANPFQRTASPMPKTYNPQQTYTGNLNNLTSSSPLRVTNNRPTTKLSVSNNKPTSRVSVSNSKPTSKVSVQSYNPGRLSGVYY